MTVYDIAVGVFIALLVRDIISLFAVEIAKRIEKKKYEAAFDEFVENIEAELDNFRKPRKKAVKKKS